MSGMFYFSVGTIGTSTRNGRKPSTLMGAARHNKREIQAELGAHGHIDPERTRPNESLAGPATAEGVVALARSRMDAAGVRPVPPRKDYVQAVELLFSLPAVNSVNEREFFVRCVEWVGEKFGAESILSADVHRDEPAPHCHVLLSPTMAGGKMRGSEMVTRPRVAAMRESFAREVARGFGLKDQPGKLKLTGDRKAQAVVLVLDRLRRAGDSVLTSALWAGIKADIERDPGRFLAILGIDPPARKLKTMAQVFTSTGKGPSKDHREVKPIGFGGGESGQHVPREPESVKPIGFAGAVDGEAAREDGAQRPIGFENTQLTGAEKNRNLSCVGFGKNAATKTSPCAAGAEASGVVADAGDQDEQPGGWLHERGGDAGPGDDLAGMPDDDGASPPRASGGDQVRVVGRASQRADPIRIKTGAGDSGAGMQRVRDDDMGPGYWDTETGEFMRCGGPQAGGRGGALPWS